jgi:hypothetical protein
LGYNLVGLGDPIPGLHHLDGFFLGIEDHLINFPLLFGEGA